MKRLLLSTFVLLAGCSAPPEDDASSSAELSASDPVSLAVTDSCTTTSVKGLSQQLVDEMNCLKPNTLKSIAGISKVSLGSAVFPYLQTPAADTIPKIVAARGTTLTVNSALRTLPQQYLLYEWYLQGRCGIGLAAAPGNSNHESGLAMDIDDNAGWNSYFSNHGWKWFGSADPVHFDYVSGGIDLRSLSVLSFQKLWNLNHPNDLIAEDGQYGPETETRLKQSPVGGFKKGTTCAAAPDAGAPKDAGTTDDAPAEAEAPPPQEDAGPPPPATDGGSTPIPTAGGCSSTGAAPDPAEWTMLALALALLTRKRGAKRFGPHGPRHRRRLSRA